MSHRALVADEPGDEPAPLDVTALRLAMASLDLGRPLIYLPVTASTNTRALELARAGTAEGTLVVADEQVAGRGRIGRVWQSMPRRQVILSLVLRPRFPPHLLVMAAALAVTQACERNLDHTGVRSAIKWPNDVLCAGRKVCGILIETGTDRRREPFAVVGIGLNVNGSLAGDPALGARAATLAELAGHSLAREAVAAALLTQLATLYGGLCADGEEARRSLRDAWRARLATLGTQVQLRQGARVEEGLAEDVDGDGALLLRRPDGSLLTVTWGDVS